MKFKNIDFFFSPAVKNIYRDIQCSWEYILYIFEYIMKGNSRINIKYEVDDSLKNSDRVYIYSFEEFKRNINISIIDRFEKNRIIERCSVNINIYATYKYGNLKRTIDIEDVLIIFKILEKHFKITLNFKDYNIFIYEGKEIENYVINEIIRRNLNDCLSNQPNNINQLLKLINGK